VEFFAREGEIGRAKHDRAALRAGGLLVRLN
jgi:hypothetical protein